MIPWPPASSLLRGLCALLFVLLLSTRARAESEDDTVAKITQLNKDAVTALQAQKFDPRGDYVRRWCPELAKLPNQWLHRPWQAPPEILTRASLNLGSTYPKPIVSHAIAREVALEAFSKLKASGGVVSQ